MPRASVGVGPMRVGSGCCVALVIPVLIIMGVLFFVFGGAAFGAPEVKKPGGSPQKTSGYKLHLKQSPTPAYIDDEKVTISWNVERTLPKGYHFVGHILNHTSYTYKCANNVYARTNSRLKGGQEAHLVFESLYDYDFEWCAGRYELSIGLQRNKTHCEEVICESGISWFIEAYGRFFNRP
jgi:hypothetical protein